jgi:hypothetical protein
MALQYLPHHWRLDGETFSSTRSVRYSVGARYGQSLNPIGLCSSATLRVLVSCESGRLHDCGGIFGFRARRTVLDPQFRTSEGHPAYIHAFSPTCCCNADTPRLPVPRYIPTREPSSHLHTGRVSRMPLRSRTRTPAVDIDLVPHRLKWDPYTSRNTLPASASRSTPRTGFDETFPKLPRVDVIPTVMKQNQSWTSRSMMLPTGFSPGLI